MGFWSKIFGVKDIGGTVKDITDGIGSLYTTDKDRLEWGVKRLEVESVLTVKLSEMETGLETFIQGELSKRHALDMQSDSWLSKNIRPLTFIHVQLLLDIIVVFAYYGYTLEAGLVALVGGIFQTIVMFYFGGRSLEKVVKIGKDIFKRESS